MNIRTLYLILALLACFAALLGLFIGAYDVRFSALFQGLTSGDPDGYVLWSVRMPRLLLAALVGAGLSMVGAALQGLFRNPLADAGLIGISSGAMLCAALAIVVAPALLPENTPAAVLNGLMLGGAFIGGLLAVIAVYRLGVRNGRVQMSIMLLAGIALASFAAALTGYLIYQSDDNQLRDLTFWTLGSISGAAWWQVGLLAGALLVGAWALLRETRTLNALGLGDREAALLGLDVERCKKVVIGSSALIVGVSIAFTGIIGFVGLIIPHALRLLIGSDFRTLLPTSAILGGIFMAFTDTLARTVVAPAELPIGILTALLGAPFFIWLLLRQQKMLQL